MYNNDDELDNESDKDNNSNDEIKEVSYGSDNNSFYKSKDSSNVFVKKIKCNNININLNGIDADFGLPNGNGPIAEAQALDDEGGNSFVSYGENGQSYSGTNSRIVCINNNNNIVIEEPEPPCDVTVDTITGFDRPFGLAHDPVNQRMYVTNEGINLNGNTVSVIDTNTNTSYRYYYRRNFTHRYRI
jgi:DNA-binding beta-propeller fold protein YncE